jgi:hypothetical protein
MTNLRRKRLSLFLSLLGLFLSACTSGGGDGGGNGGGGSGGGAGLPTNIPAASVLFVTQVPTSGFTTVSSAFGNHRGDLQAVARGGDLYILYPDGTLRNLTKEAGYGAEGFQGATAIAVREPSVHWSGTKALFSMVVGAPTEQYQVADYFWQIYEVTGFDVGETPVITKIPNQPEHFNNVSPFYGTDDRILFTSDRPRDGSAALYPQLDEYESAPTVTGLWSLDPDTGDLKLLEHAPSGVFSPSLDSFGRVIFTKWDHLQRDQQHDSGGYGDFNYTDESAGAARVASSEVFPQPRIGSGNVVGHTFNQFFPWQLNEDGTEEETLNHIGRHEFGGTYTDGSFSDDPNLTYYTPQSLHANTHYIRGDGGIFQMKEDPLQPGVFYGTYAPEFGTNAAGALLSFTGAEGLNADDMEITLITDPQVFEGDPFATGHYRNPLPLSDGSLVASHTDENDLEVNGPPFTYDFRLVRLKEVGTSWQADTPLTAGISKSVTWYDPDTLRSFDGQLWELDAAEVRARTRPVRAAGPLPDPEKHVLDDEGIDEAALRDWLKKNDLALIVSRNVTLRDRADKNQPYNLRVPGGVQAVADGGKVYDISAFQLFQADQLRGYGGIATPNPGRRVLAQVLHDPKAAPWLDGSGPAGSVKIAADGSMAAFVPARRAMSWQLTDASGNPVVQERNWISFQPGEIRSCTNCHGINTASQLGTPRPVNDPEALRLLMDQWKTTPH